MKKKTQFEILHGFGSEAKLVDHRRGAFSAASDGNGKDERRDGGRGRLVQWGSLGPCTKVEKRQFGGRGQHTPCNESLRDRYFS